MCDPAPPIDLRLTRRRLLVAAPLGVLAASILGRPGVVHAAPGLSITPRATWGGDLAPTGPIPDEPDVRVLLVHHSVNANSYAASDVPGLLRAIYRFHTADKGWPDVAYNFFVDRFGNVWEGRTGSLAGTKAGDATGGNQGFSQLCCFLGDHSSSKPSDAAIASMGALLGWLASRHGIDLSDGARAQFTSRGSNRYAAGAAVDVPTVSGHRDVTQTACPGNAAYALVTDGTFRRLARGEALATPPPAPSTAPPPPPTTVRAAPTTTTPSTLPSTTTTVASTTSSTTTTSSEPTVATASASPAATRQTATSSVPKLLAGGALAVATGAVVAVRARIARRRD